MIEADEWAGSCGCDSGLERDIHFDAQGRYLDQDCEACRFTPLIKPEEFDGSFNSEEEPPIFPQSSSE